MFDWLTDTVSGNPITYLVVFAAAGGDVLFPFIPSETIVITASVLAAEGNLALGFILLAAALGAVVGDHASYLLGRLAGDPVAQRLFRGDAGQERLRWAERATRRHGPVLVVVGRLLPGGRTATTFAAGALSMPWRRFAAADVAAAVLWATYASMLGYIGGAAFAGELWRPLGVSLALAGLIALGAEAWRRSQERRGKDLFGDDLDDDGVEPESGDERAGARRR